VGGTGISSQIILGSDSRVGLPLPENPEAVDRNQDLKGHEAKLRQQ